MRQETYNKQRIIGVRTISSTPQHRHVKLYLHGHHKGAGWWNANYIYDGWTGQETVIDVIVPHGVWFPVEGK